MSLASRMLGIPGLKVERVDWNKGIDIWAKPTKRPSCLYCGGEHLRIKATYQRTVKHSRQGNRVVTLHLKHPSITANSARAIFAIALPVFGLDFELPRAIDSKSLWLMMGA